MEFPQNIRISILCDLAKLVEKYTKGKYPIAKMLADTRSSLMYLFTIAGNGNSVDAYQLENG